MVLAPSTAEELFGTASGRPGKPSDRRWRWAGQELSKSTRWSVSRRRGPRASVPLPATSYVITRDALDISGADTVGQIIASAKSAEAVGAAKEAITAELRKAHGGAKDFSVITQKQLLSTFTQVTDQLKVFLAGIASISLLVGGIGIMNIMLVSVAERTRRDRGAQGSGRNGLGCAPAVPVRGSLAGGSRRGSRAWSLASLVRNCCRAS